MGWTCAKAIEIGRTNGARRITKRGGRYLRILFGQAAKVALMHPHRWPDFSFGEWPIRVEPRIHRNKLVVALANKLARPAWSVLHHGTTFGAPGDEVVTGVPPVIQRRSAKDKSMERKYYAHKV